MSNILIADCIKGNPGNAKELCAQYSGGTLSSLGLQKRAAFVIAVKIASNLT
ncbi:hypothetical protein PoMZ_04802 [Pyricularia oryzae]|uniref:Uncharacterized protein n=1 Tax=Pyricularia oryzae TaxID=318829 RepID=A0A4P7NAP6_PYROR|nr:hypothetical protein PoMZ_04802 [Pyricularia oryzae]